MLPPPLVSIPPARLGGKELSVVLSALAKVLHARVISLADWSSYHISEASPLLRDSLRLTKEVTPFASVPRAACFSLGIRGQEKGTILMYERLHPVHKHPGTRPICLDLLCLPQMWEWLSEDFWILLDKDFSQLKQHYCLVFPFAHQRASVH